MIRSSSFGVLIFPVLVTGVIFLLNTWLNAASLSSKAEQPDFTKGGQIPEGYKHDWNLGPTGARGWIYSNRLETSSARQILITKIEPGSPADGTLKVGDVILGLDAIPFEGDPRTLFGQAISKAEITGKLNLLCWRDGDTKSVRIKLPILGSYAKTAPWECSKSEKILQQGLEALAFRIADPEYKSVAITRSLNALALLASGGKKYLPLVKKEAEWASAFTSNGYKTWHYGYVIIFLAEYIIATGDQSVLPGLRRLALESADGQSTVGSWGHRFVQKNTRRLGGYGMMNSPGIPLTIGLVLAKKAGINDPKVSEAIEKSANLLRFYSGKGAIPYGDHRPWIQTHDDNGKNGMAAVLFDLLNEPGHAEYFSRMSVACHGPERDTGHTGNFFNMLWAMPGIARSGPHASGEWMNEFGGWYFDLARRWDGTFIHQGAPHSRHDSYRNWDCTGIWLLAYAIPKGKIHLTGKVKPKTPQINSKEAKGLILDGQGWSNNNRTSFYDSLSKEQLLSRLANWSPTVRERTGMALGRSKDVVVDQLISMLNSSNLYSQLGACQALKFQGARGAKAVPALLNSLQADDLWLRILSAEALAGIGESARVAVPLMLERLSQTSSVNDPRKMEQRYLSFSLFSKRGGLIGRSLDGVDRNLLIKSVQDGLLNEDGRARGALGSVYENLSFNEIKPLLPAIHEAILNPSPSGIMFANAIQDAGLKLFAKHRIEEGIELAANYARTQKKHGSQKRIVTVMKILESYGAHAKRAIPSLEKTVYYFKNEEQDFPKKLSLEKAKIVEQTIAIIKASTDEPRLIKINI